MLVRGGRGLVFCERVIKLKGSLHGVYGEVWSAAFAVFRDTHMSL